MSEVPAEADVIVIGAGTAGLSAAAALQSAGKRVAVVESASHIGGRCFTDRTSFSAPFDRGGSWLHAANVNPLAPLAATLGLNLRSSQWRWDIISKAGRLLDDQERRQFTRTHEEMWHQINVAGAGQQDQAISQVLPDLQFADMTKHWVAQMNGADADLVSARDSYRFVDGDGDLLVDGGLGNLIALLHRPVPVVLDCPATKIDYSGPEVRVDTAKGSLTAPCVICTVSTGVLQAEAITFTPSLPDRKQGAISQLPLGLLNKIGIEFDPAWVKAQTAETMDYQHREDGYCTFVLGVSGTNLGMGFVAGRFADLLEKEGAGAATDFCLQGLKSMFGNQITKYIRRTDETTWRADRHALGSYSYAVPGGADARAVLAEPVNTQLYFAGEATMPGACATVHGAYLSGKDVAKKVLRDHHHEVADQEERHV